MPINFPSNPINNQIYTEGSLQWKFNTSNNSWTMITTGNSGIENATNYDNTIVGLNRVTVGASDYNLQVPAEGLEFDPAIRTLKVKGLVSQTNNLLSLTDSTNTVLNGFNQRGVLLRAGMIFYGSTAPTGLNDADLGQLWYNTTSNGLAVWQGNNTWTVIGTGVTIGGNQIITGAKTFEQSIGLKDTAKIQGEGVSKSIILAPTNASSVVTNVFTVTAAAATVANGVSLDYDTLGSAAKTVTATLADNQTITGVKTINTHLVIGPSTSYSNQSTIMSSTSTDVEAGSRLVLRVNGDPSTRFIRLNNANTANGIEIRAKNSNNIGGLSITGDTVINGNTTINGNFTVSTGFASTGITIGAFRSQQTTHSATGNYSLNTPLDTSQVNQPIITPRNIGSLTFTGLPDNTFATPRLRITNTSANPVSFYYEREQLARASSSTRAQYRIDHIILGGNSVLDVPAVSENAHPTGGFILQSGTWTHSFIVQGGDNFILNDNTVISMPIVCKIVMAP